MLSFFSFFILKVAVTIIWNINCTNIVITDENDILSRIMLKPTAWNLSSASAYTRQSTIHCFQYLIIFSGFSCHTIFCWCNDPFSRQGSLKLHLILINCSTPNRKMRIMDGKIEQLLTSCLQRILELKSSTSPVYRLCIVNGEWISISDFILFTVCFCAVWLKAA